MSQKLKIANPKRFYSIVAVFILVVTMGIIGIVLKLDSKFVPGDSKYEDNVKKYAKVLQNEYNKEGAENKFIEIYNKLQDTSAQMVFATLTEDEKSFSIGVENINNILKNKEYEKLGITKEEAEYFVGEYQMDQTGKIVFTFASEDIKPNWISDAKVAEMLK